MIIQKMNRICDPLPVPYEFPFSTARTFAFCTCRRGRRQLRCPGWQRQRSKGSRTLVPWPGGDGTPIENWDCTYGKKIGVEPIQKVDKWDLSCRNWDLSSRQVELIQQEVQWELNGVEHVDATGEQNMHFPNMNMFNQKMQLNASFCNLDSNNKNKLF